MARRGPRLTIPTRIFLSIVLVLVAFGAVSGTSLYQHQRTAVRLRLLHEGYLPLALNIGQSKATQAVFGTLLDRLLSERDPTATRSWIDAARQVRPSTVQRALNGIARAERFDPPPGDAEALADIRAQLLETQAGYVEGEEAFERLYAAQNRGDEAAARAILDELRIRELRISRNLRGAWAQVQSRIAHTSRAAAEQERQFLYLVAGLGCFAVLVGLVVLFWSQRLLAPLPRLQRRVAAVAAGDLDGRIEPSRDDEIGQLSTEFERMVGAVGARDRQLREAAESLRALQQMQEQIVAGLRSAVVVVDEDGAIRSANRAAEQVLELTREDVSRGLRELGLFERLQGLQAAIQSVAGGQERAALEAAVFRRASGEPRSVDVLVTPFGAEDAERPRGSVLVVVDDVTDEVRTKQRLIQTERLAAIGRMAAHVTHEVRNPLSSIGLNVELLEEEMEGAGAESRALLRAIMREIDRLTGLTEEYLRLARLPAPRLEPEDVGEIAREVGRFVAREFETSNVTLEVDIDPALPWIAADEPQIRQALLNLLRNAREAMPEGGCVRLTGGAEEHGVVIRVGDEGEGIPADRRAHIFDLFYSTKDRGTGLGLPLTQQIVSAHGGTILCEDAEGGGTVFTMWFPAEGEPPKPVSLAPAAPEPSSLAAASSDPESPLARRGEAQAEAGEPAGGPGEAPRAKPDPWLGAGGRGSAAE